jgi:hypothetical protein
MGNVIALALTLGACYSPTLRDCRLACTNAGDCAAGQTCSDDHLCIWSSSPRRCALVDGGVDAPPPDSSATAVLHVRIDGDGRVELVGIATCDSAPPQGGDCELLAKVGVRATLVATPHDGQVFERWTSTACGGEGASCTITPTARMDVAAKFVDVRGVPAR